MELENKARFVTAFDSLEIRPTIQASAQLSRTTHPRTHKEPDGQEFKKGAGNLVFVLLRFNNSQSTVSNIIRLLRFNYSITY